MAPIVIFAPLGSDPKRHNYLFLNLILSGNTLVSKDLPATGGPHSTMDSVLASHPAAPGSIIGNHENFFGRILGVAKVDRQHWLEESEQWLENVERTHKVLVCGKLVFQKNTEIILF